MSFVITSIKHNIIMPLGAISSKRIDRVDEIVKTEYNQKQNPSDSIIVYVDTNGKSTLLIGPNQISYGNDTYGVQVDVIEKWKSTTLNILDVFLLDNICDAYEMDIMGLVESIEEGKKAASQKSLMSFTTIHRNELKKIGEPVAVGLRFVFNKDNHVLDLRVEPFLNDLSKYFFSINIKPQQSKHSIEESFVQLDKFCDFFRNDWYELIKNNLLI